MGQPQVVRVLHATAGYYVQIKDADGDWMLLANYPQKGEAIAAAERVARGEEIFPTIWQSPGPKPVEDEEDGA